MTIYVIVHVYDDDAHGHEVRMPLEYYTKLHTAQRNLNTLRLERRNPNLPDNFQDIFEIDSVEVFEG